jgi:hypothetical protein
MRTEGGGSPRVTPAASNGEIQDRPAGIRFRPLKHLDRHIVRDLERLLSGEDPLGVA